MMLEGTVSNVAQFGAFVDLGVHQDGLVHVSQLANKFVNDAREIVKTGDIVKVRVMEVDLARKRIALTMKLDSQASAGGRARRQHLPAAGTRGTSRHKTGGRQGQGQGQGGSAMAAAFAKLRSGR